MTPRTRTDPHTPGTTMPGAQHKIPLRPLSRLRSLWSPLFLALLLAIISSIAPQCAQSQPVLNFQRVINNWPTIELYFEVSCGGKQAYFTDRQYFQVEENGVRMEEFELWCPDPVMRCSVSIALILDASSSMAGSGNAAAKTAANAFIEMMAGFLDEATVVWCDQSPMTKQGMTIDTALLHSAIDSLPARGLSIIRDGIYSGLLELINNGVNQCRAVIAMTDGRDSASTRTVEEIITLANRNRVRVYTIGVGDSIDAGNLKRIANLTGGMYLERPDRARLDDVYTDISTIIFLGGDCMITYTATCMDGNQRTVDLTLREFCGGSDTKTKSFKALRDTSTFSAQRIVLGSAQAPGDTTVALPLRSLDEISAATTLHPSVLSLRYDPHNIRYVSLTVPPGSPLEGVPWRAVETDSGLTLETLDRKFLAAATPPGTVAEIVFKTRRNPGGDTVVCPLQLASCTFSAGCIRPVLDGGEIRILPLTTGVSAVQRSTEAFDLFPDPSSGALTLRVPSQPGEEICVTVTDLLGRTLLEREETSASDLHQCTLTLAPAPPGTYIVSVTAGTRRWTRTLRQY